jgi:parallel beta-helix repeat protein
MRCAALLGALVIGSTFWAADGNTAGAGAGSTVDGRDWSSERLEAGPAVESGFAHLAQRAIALAAGDLDGDRAVELLVGYTGTGKTPGGLIVLHRGDPATQSRYRFRGLRSDDERLPPPFRNPDVGLAIPVPPEIVLVGDLDGDGNPDVAVLARADDAIHLLRGDGAGGLGSAVRIALPGQVTAATFGEVNRNDGRGDLLISLDGAGGPRLLVFEGDEGPLASTPEAIALPAAAEQLGLGELDGRFGRDVALLAGGELLVLHGRDRRLASSPAVRATVAAPVLERLALERRVRTFAIGDFVPGEGGDRQQLAVVAYDGDLSVYALGDPPGDGHSVVAARPNPLVLRAAVASDANAPLSLLAGPMVSVDGDDLLLLGPGEGIATLLSGSDPDLPSPPRSAAVKGAAQLHARALPVTSSALGLAVPLDGDAFLDFVLLDDEGFAPTLLFRQRAAGNLVNSNGDQADADPGLNGCLTNVGTCTLRAAIQEHNAIGGGVAFDGSFIGMGAIKPQSQLPTVTRPLLLDGRGVVEVDGMGCFACLRGLELDGAGSGLTGMSFFRGNVGLVLFDGGGASTIAGNRLGVNLDYSIVDGGGLQITNALNCRVDDNVIKGTVRFAGTGSGGGILVRDNLIGVAPLGQDLNGGQLWFNAPVNAPQVVDNTITDSLIADNGATAVLVLDNKVGTDPSGSVALGGLGIEIRAANSTVRDNLVSGNRNGSGIRVLNPTTTNVLIEDNRVGTNAAGTAALANLETGIQVSGGGGNTVRQNLVSGNSGRGIHLLGESTGSEVLRNFVGTDVTGTVDLGNGLNGIEVNSAASTIGGPDGDFNLSSGNGTQGIRLGGGSGHIVEGNLVGTDISGTSAIPNVNGGIGVIVSGNTIRGNLVSGNSGNPNGTDGIQVSGINTSGNIIQDNTIGLAANGATPLPNTGHGVNLTSSTHDNLVGGTGGEGNRIGHNARAGVAVGSGIGNRILGNEIFANGGIGIDLFANGPTPNDPGDGDGGANNLQNFPVITNVGGTIVGTLNSIANQGFRIELFAVPDCATGEADSLLGAIDVVTDGSGNAAFNFPAGAGAVTATATRSATGDTSEISACVARPGSLINTEDNDSDLLPGDGFCDTGDDVVIGGMSRPECTLRAAIQEANARAGEDRLLFDPAGPAGAEDGSYRIVPTGALPAITEKVVIGGAPGALEVELDGTVAGGGVHGLDFAGGADDSEVRRLIIYRFSGDGIRAQFADRMRIVDSVVGTDRADGAFLGNGGAGIRLLSVEGGRIGGAGAAEGNHVAGNGGPGIALVDSRVVVVEGNLVGTTSTGAAALANAGHGVEISDSDDCRVGGDAGAQNIVSGNGLAGVALRGNSDRNEVVGNRIGTNLIGAAPLANQRGVLVEDGAEENIVGGNLISGNLLEGVHVAGGLARQNLIAQNSIGVDASGTAALPNGSHGVLLTAGANGNVIGPEGNRIAFNAGDGIRVTGNASVGNRFDGNELFANGGLGIDLAGDGVTPNDPGDGDVGPNNRQNFPVITSYDQSGVVRGTFNGAANTGFLIELFKSAACDASGNGEAERFVAFAGVTTAADGSGTWSAVPGFDPAMPFLTALAIRQPLLDDTSELSACTASLVPPPALLINEVEADTQGPSSLEFIELFSRGAVGLPLAGKVLVFFDGASDTSYAALDLDGFTTDGAGFFVAGNADVPNVDLVFDDDLLLDGPSAAVALYDGNAIDFPPGTPVTTNALLDAVVYGGGAADDGLLPLLLEGQPQVDEGAGGDGGLDALQRCANGAGEPRESLAFAAAPPTAGMINHCLVCTLSPLAAQVEGDSHGVVVRVREDRVDPVAGVIVALDVVAGPDAGPIPPAVTDLAGEAAFDLRKPPGANATAELEASGALGGTTFVCRASVSWSTILIHADGFE